MAGGRMWMGWVGLMAGAATFEASPGDDLEGVINGLGAGDELLLGGGTYTLEQRTAIGVAGTKAAPVVVRSKAGERAHIHRPNAAQNLIDFEDVAWLELRDIEFSGGSAGLRFVRGEHVRIVDCEIHSTGDVALRANDTGAVYRGFEILRNQIHHTDGTGEGMYLGCNDGECTFRDGLIAGNWVHHTDGPGVSQGDGIELKEGSFGNVIRDNVVHDTRFPCILTYSTLGAGPPNVIEGNVVWGCGDHGIQSAADAVIRNNLVLSAAGSGIAMQPHASGAPSHLTVVHNTVLSHTGAAAALSIRHPIGEVVVGNNALFAPGEVALFGKGDMGWVVATGNAVDGAVQGLKVGTVAADRDTDLVDAHSGGAPPIDVFPAVGSALIGAGDPAHTTPRDFNGSARSDRVDVGAYAFDVDGNPGWAIASDFKGDLLSPTDAGPTDAGPTDTGEGLIDGGTRGCGCAAGRTPRVWWLLAVGLAWARRRSSRSSPGSHGPRHGARTARE